MIRCLVRVVEAARQLMKSRFGMSEAICTGSVEGPPLRSEDYDWPPNGIWAISYQCWETY